MSLSRVHACEGFCVSISLCMMGNRLVFMPMKSLRNLHSLSLLLSLAHSLSLFSPTAVTFSFFLNSILYFCHSFPLPSLCPSSLLPSFHPFRTSLASTHPHLPCPSPSPFPVNTVIAWGTFQCVSDLSPLVLFMALSLFKFNQASKEPPAPFQFTTWTQQDGKSYANIKV